jgi:SAM-dependent methyltransferase
MLSLSSPPARVSLELLRCPVTGEPLEHAGEDLLRTSDGAYAYPIADGVPVLLAASSELFGQDGHQAATDGSRRRLRRLADRLPQGSRNVGAPGRFRRFLELTLTLAERPRVLVIGAGTLGAGSEILVESDQVDLVETDIFRGPRTAVICDAHALPFADGAFDGVVCQAVLEHVLEPWTVAEEIHRVLGPDGVVYSEVPFMQQVHEGAYDFTRFTHLGHRRLFRSFEEVDSGAQGGPGMALSWSIQYFLMAFAWSRLTRAAIQRAAGLLTSWLTVFDGWLVRRAGGLDAASGTWFLGRRRDQVAPDAEIIKSYRGACPSPER